MDSNGRGEHKTCAALFSWWLLRIWGLNGHRDIAWRLAEAGDVRVLLVDYRLAPEHPFPAALEDAIECYRWLLAQGTTPDKIAIGGDSAGGGLSVATLVNIKNLGMPMPNCSILLSPWTDLSLSGDSIGANAEQRCDADRRRIKENG